MSRNYESIILFDSALTEPQLEEEVAKVSKFIKAEGAENLTVDHWGRREIAYQLRKLKKRHAFYVCYYFESNSPDLVDNLNKSLRINDAVLLFQTHRIAEATRKFQGRTNRPESEDAYI